MEKKLQRDENNKMLAGVAAGLAEYFEVDPTWVRVIFVLMAIFGLSGVLIYIILWIVVPPKPFFADFRSFDANYQMNQEQTDFQYKQRPAGFSQKKKQGNGRFIAGLILVVVGLYFFLDEFYLLPYWFSIARLWPVVFIIIGLMILGGSRKKQVFNDDSAPFGQKGQTMDDKGSATSQGYANRDSGTTSSGNADPGSAGGGNTDAGNLNNGNTGDQPLA